MSTGTDGNGLTTPAAYSTRTKTWVALTEIASADLNAIQDGIIAVSDGLDDLAGQAAPSRTASENQSDSPAPTASGGAEVWIEATTNGTTPVLLDDSIDWRDRQIICMLHAWLASDNNQPGGANDDDVREQLNDSADGAVFAFYSRDGQDGTLSTERGAWAPGGGDQISFYADDTDGHLYMVKVAAVNPALLILGCIKCSPVQNHY